MSGQDAITETLYFRLMDSYQDRQVTADRRHVAS